MNDQTKEPTVDFRSPGNKPFQLQVFDAEKLKWRDLSADEAGPTQPGLPDEVRNPPREQQPRKGQAAPPRIIFIGLSKA